MEHVHLSLVVEDDDWMREAMVDALRSAAGEAVGARDGAEGLRRLDAEPRPCMIFLDLQMPGMDGRQFMAELRRRPAVATLPVVIVTGYGTAEDAKALGGVDWLRKPFAFDRLPELVVRHCRGG